MINRLDLTDIKDLRTAMSLAGISPKKSFGQNFLVDKEALEKIVSTADLKPGETVLEIGPGLGTLTNELMAKAVQVISLEADEELAALLARRAEANLKVVATDALQYDLNGLPVGYKVVANLPYYITSPLLRFLLESQNKPQSITVLVQKEVAERIVASPGQMSVLACSVQYYGKPKLISVVPAKSFYPIPKVDSAILHIELLPKPLFDADSKQLFRLIKAGFGEKRKMLQNALAGGLNMPSSEAAELIGRAGIKATARAQELSMVDWQNLYSEFNKHKG